MRVIELILLVVAFLGVIIYGVASDSFVTLAHFSVAIFLGALPFLVIACVISGFLSIILPARLFNRFSSQNKFSFWKGILFGLFLPIVPPAASPFARALARRGASGLGGLFYFLAADSLSPVVFFSTLVAFGLSWKMALARYALALIVLILIGGVFKFFFRSQEQIFIAPVEGELPEELEEKESTEAAQSTASNRTGGNLIGKALRAGADQFLATARLLIVASVLAAILIIVLPRSAFAFLSGTPAHTILAMIALSLALSVPSSTDSFIAVSFGLVPGWAKMAFLLAGPLLNLKLLHLYSSFLSRRAVITLLLSTTVVVFLLMLVVVYSGLLFD